MDSAVPVEGGGQLVLDVVDVLNSTAAVWTVSICVCINGRAKIRGMLSAKRERLRQKNDKKPKYRRKNTVVRWKER